MSKFSEDIIFEILSWLPVSSLLRFRVVCKSWFILITQNSSFAKSQLLHANSTQIDNPTVLFASRYHGTLCSFKYVDIASSLSFINVTDNENLMKHPATLKCFQSAASCNGLICISMFDKTTTFCLWNPSTEEIKELPEIPYKHPTQWYHLFAFGFGCNRTLDDYKVIRIMHSSTLDVWDDNEENLYINVYTLGTNSWKRIRDMPCKFRLTQARSGLHINGGLHWIGSVSPFKSNKGIFSFDIEDEEFRDVPKPQCLGGMDNAGLHVLGGCLCIFDFYSENCLDVWMMKDYGVKESWTKLFTTSQFKFMDHQRLKPLWLFKHGGILMCMEIYVKSLALYDPNCDTFEYIGSQPFNVGWFDTVTYIESLVSLGSGCYA